MGKRDDIKSGDLLIWKKSKKSFLSNLAIGAIRLFTRSEYAHVGIAWRIESNTLHVFEATQPAVRVVPLEDGDEFYHIPMSLKWTEKSSEFLQSKLGLKYSIFDAIRAFLGITLDADDRYQCAELANEFYAKHGIYLTNAYTPSEVVEAILEKIPTALIFVPRE